MAGGGLSHPSSFAVTKEGDNFLEWVVLESVHLSKIHSCKAQLIRHLLCETCFKSPQLG